MSEAKPDIVQAHGDGIQGHSIISELKNYTNHVEENLVGAIHKKSIDADFASNGSSSSGKSNATSLKMLLAKEMANEAESKRRSPSVIARLMGLEEDSSAKETIIHHLRSDTPVDSKAINKAQGKEHHQSVRLMTQDVQQFQEYKDVYEVCEDQSGTSCFQDRTPDKLLCYEKNSRQSGVVQEKFMEPKCFGMEEKLPQTKKLKEGLKISRSNKDFLLELPDECYSSLSRHQSRLHTNQAPPQTKRITVLKPVGSAEISGVRLSQTERVNKQNGLKVGQFHQSPSSKEETPSQPSRIIVLRPTPGKPDISKAKLTPRATSFQLAKRNNLSDLSYNEVTVGSSGRVHGVKQHWHDGYHQRDDSLLSSAHSSGYLGDESSCGDSEVDQSSGSEIEYIDEAGSSSDSEENSSQWRHSWNYIRGDEGPYSGSFREVGHFPESSITREAKKQLSERWATVTCDEICKEKLQPSRKTCTLGEMLSIEEAKKEVCATGILSVSSEKSCGMEKEQPMPYRKDNKNAVISPRKLPITNSAPVISSMLDNIVVNVQLSNPEIYKPKLVVVSNKGKLSFKGRVSDVFLSKDKKPRRQKSTHHPSDCCAERVVHSRLDHDLNRDANQKAVHCRDKVHSYSMQISSGTSERTSSIGVSLDCTSGILDKLGVSEGPNSNPDQPSPTSVLDARSEDSSCNEPETSARTSKNASKSCFSVPKYLLLRMDSMPIVSANLFYEAVSRSSAVEAVACSLSWDNTSSEVQLLCTRRSRSLISDADTDESESHVLVQNIMSSSKLGGASPSMVFTGWHLPHYPLDPVLCNKILELREQSSYRRLMFDCVNAALAEIGENALLSAFPCSKAHSRTLRETSAPEVWSVLKDWIYGARVFVVSKKGNAGVILNRIVKQEVEGRGWVKMMIAQVVDITEELEGGVMEELVEEAVLDFSACFQR
ncbi:hypothetical protein PR202_ga01987 [Eleusine coracana subsp. coracana]|uniref:DUF4378 domain-containing protein n=1 Tax=Eleusine coracana subsp. coracana TaxID=191504 RepID=A0AAV5BL08_ELECO|nr:hypothetical protein PR202_ga01300 [Eleusine coracana subsp. coracana]GJM86157.1 hypothetical protein PR202_ga01987 [Eleusine coracana subsp. coracana]